MADLLPADLVARLLEQRYARFLEQRAARQAARASSDRRPSASRPALQPLNPPRRLNPVPSPIACPVDGDHETAVGGFCPECGFQDLSTAA